MCGLLALCLLGIVQLHGQRVTCVDVGLGTFLLLDWRYVLEKTYMDEEILFVSNIYQAE